MSVELKEIVAAINDLSMAVLEYATDDGDIEIDYRAMRARYKELVDRIEAEGIAPPDGMVLVPVEQFASRMADLQPLGLSQNRGDRLWQLYRTPEECILDIKKAIQTAAEVKP